MIAEHSPKPTLDPRFSLKNAVLAAPDPLINYRGSSSKCL